MFTDIFIKRPVLATVISLLLLSLGLRALYELPLRQFPKVENTVITVTTSYPGANAQTIKEKITTTLEQSIASAGDIDYLTAISHQGQSVIQVHVTLNANPDAAFTHIQNKVAQVVNQLPKESQTPVITEDSGASIALMYLSFTSPKMTPEETTDYISRVIQPQLSTIPGVASAQILGGSTFAMRIWLNPTKMHAHDVTAADVVTALQTRNILTAGGTIKGNYVSFNIQANTELQNEKDFKNLVVKNAQGALVRLDDVARIELGAETYDSSVTFNGQQAVFVGITTTPSANPLTVINAVKKTLPTLAKSYPKAFTGSVVYDATTYIRASIHEVIRTIVEATLIVLIVIFLFLGSLRSVVIPIVTIPLSIVGVCSVMLGMGYSLNLLTLLAMVLAIGVVVDDAIVVVENIHRHIEEGLTPFHAAIQGAREIAMPVISMTITLAAVYAPIGLTGGITGALFKEFAFTLAGAVVISGVIALTLSPMMSSLLLKKTNSESKLVLAIDNRFTRLKDRYQRLLLSVLAQKKIVLGMGLLILISCFFLYAATPKELAPEEDQSVLFVSGTAPQSANINFSTAYTRATPTGITPPFATLSDIFKSIPEEQAYFVINGMGAPNNVIAGLILKPWNERKASQKKVQAMLRDKFDDIPGLKVVAFGLPSLPIGDNALPIQFVLTSTDDYKTLYKAAQQVQMTAMKSGRFMFLDNDLKYDNPQLDLNINRDKAADLGINLSDISAALAYSFGGNYINHFNQNGKSYQVIPQFDNPFRIQPNNILNKVDVRTASGKLIPLSTFSTLKTTVEPNQLPEFQQLNSVTIQGMVMPGLSMGEGLDFLSHTADQLPATISHNYAGQSRQFIQEGDTLLYTMLFSLLIIFLVLAAQFESFTDPLIILISVPMSICGALVPLNVGLGTINIYTQIGLITLIGLISKHGILIVDFANKLQVSEGLSKQEAVIKAASIRLRPILMTTAAMVFGVLPLLLATGAGAVSRFDIGLVIASGMVVGTVFTLFMVPTVYTYLAKDHRGKTE